MHMGKCKAFQANLLTKRHGVIQRLMVFGSLAIRKNQRGWSRCVLLPTNSECPTRMVGGEVGGHAHWQVQGISGQSLNKAPWCDSKIDGVWVIGT